MELELQRLKNTWVHPATTEAEQLNGRLKTELTREYNLADLIKRPELGYNDVAWLKGEPIHDVQAAEQVEIQLKYSGYIERQKTEIEQMRRQENTRLPDDFDYSQVSGLSNELKLKLGQQRPETLAQASRIQGMTPAAISLLLVYLKKRQLSHNRTQVQH